LKSILIRPGITRFILAMLVISFHLSPNAFFGSFAVGAFFMLSGYWISMMYTKKYLLKAHTLQVFYTSRIWRIFPVFLICTCLMLISQLLSHADWLVAQVQALVLDKQIRFYFSNFFILSYSTTGYQLLAPAWSLDIEMQFYLLFPLLAYLVGLNRKWLLYLTPLVFLIALYGNVTNVFWITQTLAKYLFLFMLGMIAYYYQLKPNKSIERVANIGLLLLVLSQYLIPGLGQYYRVEHSPYYEGLTFAMLILVIPLLLRSVHTETSVRDRFWGEMSFLIYLVHGVYLVPYNLLIEGMPKSHRLPYVAGFLIATLLTAYLLYIWVDRPSEMKRQLWVKNKL